MANTKITSKVIADDAILTANITDANVTTAKIAADAITGAKIADDVALGGNPTTTTQSAGNNTTRVATTAFVSTAVSNLVDSSPSALNTLNELAAALGDDANFSTTVTNSIAAKLPLAGGTMTGALDLDGQELKLDADADTSITADTDDVVDFKVGGTDRLKIAANNLFLNGGTDARIQLGSGGAGANQVSNNTVHIRGDGVDAKYMAASGGDHIFESNGGHLVTMKDSGNVGIGTTSPTSYSAFADNLVVAGAAETGITIASGNSSQSGLYFSDGTSGTEQYIGFLDYNHSTNVLNIGTSGANQVHITSGDGTIGVGVNDPKAHIHTHIASSGGAYHQFTNSSTGAGSDKGWKIGIHDDENLIIWGQESTEMFAIYNNGAYRFYVDHNGNTVIPQNSKLIVSGEEGSFSAGSHNGHEINPNGQSASGRAATNTQTHRSFLNPNGTVGQITTSGTTTTYGGTSDYRLKENVVTDWDGTTLLKQLKPSKFNFKADADTIIQGFLAHEVSSIVPEAVVGEKDAVYTAEEAAEDIIAVEGQPKYQQIDHSKLVPLLVKTVQELEARIKTLEDA